MNLPLALNFMADYRIGKGFYLNLNPIVAMRAGKNDVNKTHYFTNFAFTPRWENRWFGVYIPIEYNNYMKLNSGLSLRLGPVFVGSGNLLSNIGSGETNKVDVAGGVKVPIPYPKPKDKDKDGVSDKLDLCPNLKGRWETKGCPDRDGDVPGIKAFSGCPDRDGDGIQDSEDACPDVAGKLDLQGCPDRDNDGIADKDDRCPDIAGTKTFNGCPDTDKDGIADIDDDCPNIAGPKENNGCPYADTDGDGVLDKDDRCPTVKGPLENYGCPYSDTDEDGVLDKDDACPTIKGPVENKGCPYSDTDGDGVIDLEDDCPATPGPASNKGCPVIEEKVKEILKTVFDNLEFETGKAVIRESSYSSLDELAELLVKKPEYRLLIEGHTDNVGSRESNMTLSRNRANSVQAYLLNKGVKDSQMKTNYYGPDKPIDTNATPEGRQRNRRVEFNIYFE
jgi:outer membrane protein OmpA-like peptidoglycan-associated protein